MNLHEQARAEAEKRADKHFPTPGDPWKFTYEDGFKDGYLAGHEAATRTREWSSIDPPPGWFTFGTHVEHDGPLEFSEAVGDDLMPLWERPATHPRVVTTVTELDALPEHAVIVDAEGMPWHKPYDNDHGWWRGGPAWSHGTTSNGIVDYGPFRVLYEPEEAR